MAATSPPTHGDRYRTIRQIGSGGFATAYLVMDTLLDRELVVKVLRPEWTEEGGRLLKEARAAAKLNHKNIVTIYDVVELEGGPYIAMEYVHGETLAELIRAGRPMMTLDRQLRLVGDLCDGLACAHDAGLIHRDIKPANLMIKPNGELKILDFGIARVTSSESTVSPIGTPQYMSPEQIQATDLDRRADIFAVGLVMYELLTGIRAFDAPSPSAVIYKVLHVDVPSLGLSPAWLNAELTRIVAGATHKNREQRYPDIRALQRDLEVVRLQLESTAAAVTLATPVLQAVSSAQSTRPRKLRSAVLAGAGVAILALTGLLVWFGPRSHTAIRSPAFSAATTPVSALLPPSQGTEAPHVAEPKPETREASPVDRAPAAPLKSTSTPAGTSDQKHAAGVASAPDGASESSARRQTADEIPTTGAVDNPAVPEPVPEERLDANVREYLRDWHRQTDGNGRHLNRTLLGVEVKEHEDIRTEPCVVATVTEKKLFTASCPVTIRGAETRTLDDLSVVWTRTRRYQQRVEIDFALASPIRQPVPQADLVTDDGFEAERKAVAETLVSWKTDLMRAQSSPEFLDHFSGQCNVVYSGADAANASCSYELSHDRIPPGTKRESYDPFKAHYVRFAPDEFRQELGLVKQPSGSWSIRVAGPATWVGGTERPPVRTAALVIGIYVYREWCFNCSILNPTVSCDGEKVAKLEKGIVFRLTLPPGSHRCRATGFEASADPIELSIESDKAYFLRFNKDRFDLVPSADALKVIRKLKPIDPKQVLDSTKASPVPVSEITNR
jgi:serine/threonine protein kinase